jgi:hypothetical protein
MNLNHSIAVDEGNLSPRDLHQAIDKMRPFSAFSRSADRLQTEEDYPHDAPSGPFCYRFCDRHISAST